MISIDRLEEMTIEELQIKLKNFEEQIKLQNNFIDSLFKATNNSEWLDKSMLDDEVSEVIEKIELDYEQLDQLKAENVELKKIIERLDVPKHEVIDMDIALENEKLKQTIVEIKEVLQLYNNTTIGIDKGNGIFEFEVSKANVLGGKLIYYYDTNPAKKALQKISEVE